MKKGIGNIELLRRPLLGRGDSEHNADDGRFDDQRERLTEIHTNTLGEAMNNPSCLVAIERAIWIEFVREDPLCGDNVGTERRPNATSRCIAAHQLGSQRAT